MLVLGVDSRGRWSVELLSILASKLSIFGLLSIEHLLTLIDHVRVQLLHLIRSLDGLGEVLGCTLLLELFNLGPDCIWDVTGRRDGVKALWQSILLQEASHLVVELRDLCELILDDLLNLVLQFISIGTNIGWYKVSELLI